MLISIIIPVYNEEKFILKLLFKVKAVKNIKKEVIVVNDGSTDKTFEILKKNKLKKLYTKLITYKKNRGKGFACRKGIQNASGKIIIIQDGDLEYNPKNYSKLLKPILLKKTNIVYGSRVLHGGKRVRPNTFGFKIRIFANHFLTYLSNLINNQKLTDAHTCYKVFKKDTVKRIKLRENGFNFCPEITTKFSKLNEKIVEVPIDYFGRTVEEGKKIQFFDGFRAIYCLIKYKFIFK
tara:strand:- start:5361 stop:6068 length:708 start_codon:yes stop_codon:yes gene_type:complete